MKYANLPGFVLGFHGCDEAVGERVLAGSESLQPSENAYDWLGKGIYFWENDPLRAQEWAIERSKNASSPIKNPFVVGAIIDLGYCLGLMQREHIAVIEKAYEALKIVYETSGDPMPENVGGGDKFKRNLDCAVIEMVHLGREVDKLSSFDSVRGLFLEDEELYPNSGFRRKNHIQICVRNADCIKGYFRPLG